MINGSLLICYRRYGNSQDESLLSAVQGRCCAKLQSHYLFRDYSLEEVHTKLQYVSRCPFIVTTAW